MEEKINEILNWYHAHIKLPDAVNVTEDTAEKLAELSGHDVFKIAFIYKILLNQNQWIGYACQKVEISFQFDNSNTPTMFINASNFEIDESDWLRHHILPNRDAIRSMYWCLLYWIKDLAMAHADKLKKKKPEQKTLF